MTELMLLMARKPALRDRDDLKPYLKHERTVVRGEIEWFFDVTQGAAPAIAEALGAVVCEQLSPTRLLLHFGNAVGQFEVPGYGVLEVVSGKWGERHFERMLAELTEIAAGLPFAARGTAALPYDRSVVTQDDVLYHAFVYLRFVLSEAAPVEKRLLPALHLVLQEPHQQFARTRRVVPLETAQRIDSTLLEHMVSGRQPMTAVSPAVAARVPLATRLKGYLPEQVHESQVVTTYDTPENRFVLAFLQFALGVIEGMRTALQPEQTSAKSRFANRVLQDCALMERALQPIVRHALWAEVGPMVHVPMSSPVLQRRRGYRDMLQHFVRLRMATRVPLPDAFVRQLLETKDIDQLYELWCYFAVVAQVQELLGRPLMAERPEFGATDVAVRWGFIVAWENGTRLLYNPTFSRGQYTQRFSYSVQLRPDILLEVTQGPNRGLHVLDAKFKLKQLDAALPPDEETADKTAVAKRESTTHSADIYKMHTYLDALRGVRSAWILYPGSKACFFPRSGAPILSAMADLPEVVTGVGAVALRPSKAGAAGLTEVLWRLLGL